MWVVRVGVVWVGAVRGWGPKGGAPKGGAPKGSGFGMKGVLDESGHGMKVFGMKVVLG